MTPSMIHFRRIHPDATIPEYKTPGACAFDLAVIEGATLAPGERRIFRTGLIIEVPLGYVLVLAARSSNARKGIQLTNGIGIIDQDYSGPSDEIYLSLYNVSGEPYVVASGERLAQGMLLPMFRPAGFEEVAQLADTDRGGFGSTG